MPVFLNEEDILTIPQTSEVVANIMWIESLTIVAPGPGQEAAIALAYYPMTEGNIVVKVDENGFTTKRYVVLDNVFATMQECPELATAFTAILACILPVKAILAAREV